MSRFDSSVALSSDDDEENTEASYVRHPRNSEACRRSNRSPGVFNKPSPSGGLNKNANHSISLAQFERERLSEDGKRGGRRGRGDSRDEGWASGAHHAAWPWVEGFWSRVQEALERVSLWKAVLVGALLGLVCALAIAAVGRLQLETSTDNLLPCPSEAGSTKPCILQNEIRSAVQLASAMRSYLYQRAGQLECGISPAVVSKNISLGNLISVLTAPPEEKSSITSNVKNALYLILFNPQWEIKILSKQGLLIEEWNQGFVESDVLVSSRPSVGLWCRVSLFFNALWSSIKSVLIVVVGAVVLLVIVRWRWSVRQKRKKLVFLMVDNILNVLRNHENLRHRKSDENNVLLPFLAIVHVRDLLINPSERQKCQDVWEEAVKWIAAHESRVRVETGRIAGEDFEVWRWIQAEAPPTDMPSSAAGSRREGNWQGRAFGYGSPSASVREDGSSLPHSLSEPSTAIRLKNMFEPTRHMDEEQASEIQNSVLDRCVPHGDVIHLYVDRKSPFGCVYLKMDSVPSAIAAYKTLHGGWYKGKLVTAKYVPEFKYLKWFPQSAISKTPLQPT